MCVSPIIMDSESTSPATRFHVAVDVVALTINDGLLQVAVVQREGNVSCIAESDDGPVREVPREPFDYALPGGLVNWESENLVEAAQREVREETGISIDASALEQIGAYGDVGRDPRSGRTISVAYVAFSPKFASPLAGGDAVTAKFMDVVEVLAEPNRLEFDHGTILRHAIQKVRQLMETKPIALQFCDEEFTMSELRHVYEVMFHHAYNADADTRRFADRLRNDSGFASRRSTNQQIARISRALSEASSDLAMSFSDVPMRQSSGRSATRDSDVISKMQNLLAEEYRRSWRVTDSRSSTARDRLKLSFDPANFARKVEAIPGFVQRVEGRSKLSSSGIGKPAQVYRKGKATQLDPPLVVPKKPTKAPKRAPRS